MLSMNAYSKDLRLKTLAAIDRGIPRKEVSELFGVSLSTIKRWLKTRRLTGGVETMKIPGRPSVKGRALREWLPEQLESNPDLTLAEHCEAFEEETGIEVSEATMSRNIERLPGQWPLKKSKVAQERDEGLRSLWRWLVSRFDVRLASLVFVDESVLGTPRWIVCAPGLREGRGLTARYPETLRQEHHPHSLNESSWDGRGDVR